MQEIFLALKQIFIADAGLAAALGDRYYVTPPATEAAETAPFLLFEEAEFNLETEESGAYAVIFSVIAPSPALAGDTADALKNFIAAARQTGTEIPLTAGGRLRFEEAFNIKRLSVQGYDMRKFEVTLAYEK